MAFRDELGAAQARAGALEKRVAELESENRELREEATAPIEPAVEGESKSNKRGLLLAVVAALVFGGAAFGTALIVGPVAYAVFAVLAVAVIAMLIVLSMFVEHVPPGFAIVLSGGRQHDDRGYRVAMAGRVVRIPIIEVASRLDLRPRTIEREFEAWARGGEKVMVKLAATVRVGSAPPIIDNAIERFLGRDVSDVERVAAETVEGAARGVVAGLEKASLRGDPESTSKRIIEAAEDDLGKTGIVLDTLVASVD